MRKIALIVLTLILLGGWSSELTAKPACDDDCWDLIAAIVTWASENPFVIAGCPTCAAAGAVAQVLYNVYKIINTYLENYTIDLDYDQTVSLNPLFLTEIPDDGEFTNPLVIVSLNDAVQDMADCIAQSRAAVIAHNRYLSAIAAGDSTAAVARFQQLRSFREAAQEKLLGFSTSIAVYHDALEAESQMEAIEQVKMDVYAGVAAVQEELVTSGWPEGEQPWLMDLQVTPTESADMIARVAALEPFDAVLQIGEQVTFLQLMDLLRESSEILGSRHPFIRTLNCANWVPMADEPITVTAEIVDSDVVSSVSLHYAYSDGVAQDPFSVVGMSLTPASVWSGPVPSSHTASQVDFYVSATYRGGESVLNPSDAPASFRSVALGLKSIYAMQYVPEDSPSQDGAYSGRFLNVRGVVTAGTGEAGPDDRFIIQEVNKNPATGTYGFGGVVVCEKMAENTYFRGDLVEVGGKCVERDGLTIMEAHDPSAINLVGFGQSQPAASRVNTRTLGDCVSSDGNGFLGEKWESVWVKTYVAAVVDTLGRGAYIVSDTAQRADSLIVDPLAPLVYSPVIGEALTVEGFMSFSGDRPRLVPISDENIVIGVTGAEVEQPPRSAPSEIQCVAPNPFNPRTTIRYSLPQATLARLSIYDLQGRLVRQLVDEAKAAGDWSAEWDGRDDAGRAVASGSYMVRLVTDQGVRTSKLTMAK